MATLCPVAEFAHIDAQGKKKMHCTTLNRTLDVKVSLSKTLFIKLLGSCISFQ